MLVACTFLGAYSTIAAEPGPASLAPADVKSPSSDAKAPSPDATGCPERLRLDETPPDREQRQPRGQAALTVGLPFFPDKYVEGELAVDVRYGYKFWWVVPYVSVGFRQVRLDPLGWPWEARNRKLLAVHLTVGARLEFPASPKLYPFVGFAMERSSWAYTEDSTSYCHESWYPDSWRCYQAMDWKDGYALKPQVGLVYKPESSLGLEFWLEYIHVTAPDMFNRSIHFFSPSLGLAWHH